MKLTLRAEQLNVIRHQVITAYPAEACGLFSGAVCDGDFLVTDAWPAPNLLADMAGRFELDPRHRLKVEKICRQSALKVIGHWHSHPSGKAEPSAIDANHAYEPDLVWLILATDGQSVSDIQAFAPPQSPGGSFQPIDLIIISAPA